MPTRRARWPTGWPLRSSGRCSTSASPLEAAGGDVSHVVRLRFYVVGWDPSKIEEFMAGGGAAVAQLPGLPRTAVTVIGVQALFTPDLLVEVEAEAVVPWRDPSGRLDVHHDLELQQVAAGADRLRALAGVRLDGRAVAPGLRTTPRRPSG